MARTMIGELAQAQELLCGSSEIVIYGSSGIGRHIYFALHPYSDRIEGFCDGNPRLAGVRLYGKPVVPPAELVGRKNLLILIGVWNRKAREEIVATLDGLGVEGAIIDFTRFTLDDSLALLRARRLARPALTLLSNGERGEHVARSLGLPGVCFTSGMRMTQAAFLYLCGNLEDLLGRSMTFTQKQGFTSGRIGSFEVDFPGAHTVEEARTLWGVRTASVCLGNWFILVDDDYFAFTVPELAGLARTGARSVAVLTNQILSDDMFRYAGITGAEEQGRPGGISLVYRQFYHQDYISLGKQEFETMEQNLFDVVEWLNTGLVRPTPYPEPILD